MKFNLGRDCEESSAKIVKFSRQVKYRLFVMIVIEVESLVKVGWEVKLGSID